MISNIYPVGLTGPSGEKYVVVEHADKSACIPLAKISIDERGARTAIVSRGIMIMGSRNWAKFLDKVGNIREFPDAAVIESVGWNGDAFALPDCSVITKDGTDPTYLAIEPQRGKCAESGSFAGWRSKVAEPLAGLHLATFLLMSAFMPPLLRLTERVGNVGFEIVGPPGIGKSTLQYLISSALGGVMQDSSGHYWVSLDTTYNALEDMMKVHSDLPLIMDEANLMAAADTPKVRGEVFKALAFKLYSGTLKGRFGAPAEPDFRLGFIISSNEPLASLLGQSNDVARAAQDRLITIPITKTFDLLPEGYSNSGQFAKELIRSAQRHHGHAIKKFLAGLVKEKADNEKKLRARIRKLVAEFQRQAGVDLNNGSASRVAEAFGLVYAAGSLAKRYQVLPDALAIELAAIKCYRLHLGHLGGRHLAFRERLLALQGNEKVAAIKKGGHCDATSLAYFAGRKGQRELLVPPENIASLFPDWDSIKTSSEVAKFLQREGNAYKVKRVLPGRQKARVFCFRMPRD